MNHFLTRMKKGIELNREETDKSSVKDLGELMKEMPWNHEALWVYSTHLHLMEDCMKAYQNRVDRLCGVEQDLAMGTNVLGEKIKDHMRDIVPILLDNNSAGFSSNEKLRIILLYVLAENGISEENLNELIQQANIDQGLRCIITNMAHLGVNVVVDGQTNRKKGYTVPRKDRITEQTYQMSRWTPVVKDIVEDCIEQKLVENQFPYCAGRAASSTDPRPAASARNGQWDQEKGHENMENVPKPRVIVFIVGGLTFSEMRTAYEITDAFKNWEVIIGSTHILVPDGFLSDLKELSMNNP